MKIIEEKDIEHHLKNKIWLVSHGGVGSEYLTKLLNIEYPNIKIKSRPFKGCVVHFPYPVKTGPKLCIYLYGDIYNSIISQTPRHYDNSKKLHNNENYSEFHSIDDILKHSSSDPFGITKQIKNFMSVEVDYPIILLKYPLKKHSIRILEKFLCQKIDYKFKKRISKLEILNKKNKDKLIKLYKDTDNIIKNLPDVIIRYPKNQKEYTLSDKDITNIEIKSKNLEGNRIKHFLEKGNTQVYNERDVKNLKTNTLYGRLKIKTLNSKVWETKEFKNQLNLNVECGGIEDPRIFKFNDNIFVLGNGLTKNTKQREMYLYNVNKDKIVKLWFTNHDISKISQQKNWTPYVYKDELYFIYSFNELCVLKLKDIDIGKCEVVKGNPLNHNDDKEIYGSTPFIPWNFPYYIGFAHTRNPWRAIPIKYNVENMEIVKVGNVINFTNPKEAIPWRGKSVQFPYDLRIKNGEIILGIEFEDRCPTLLNIDYISFCKQFKT